MANYTLDAYDPVFADRQRRLQTGINPDYVPPGTGTTYMNTGGNLPPLVQTATMSTPLPPTQQAVNTGGNQPPQTVTMQTGGNQPPVAVVAPPMSTPLPPLVQTMQTGGNQPPVQYTAPPMSQPLPPLQLSQLNLPALTGQNYVATQTNGNGPAMGADQIVQNTLASLLDRNNPYIARARQAAIDQAGERGMVNSSIAAGNAEGAAIDAVMPLVNQSLGIQQQRENNAFTANENLLGRTQGVNNALLAGELQQRQTAYDYNFRNQLQSNQTMQQDWLNNNEFSRNFNATLSMLPVNNAVDMAKAIQLYAAQDPETYTPQVVSGITNFFNQNMLAIMQQYFPDMFGGG